MDALYGPFHRSLQERHGTRPLADRLEAMSHAALEPADRAFVEAASMFFLATVDAEGRPTVSYKGGAPGFVRVDAPGALSFPSYDGNGMFLSLGNIASSAQIGLLFIDFAQPHRLRVQGTARVDESDAALAAHPGAVCVVRVAIDRVFVNCGRYIHGDGGRELSRHLPDAEGRQPFPAWKRIDVFDGALSPQDEESVAGHGGRIGIDAYRGES